MNPEKIVISGVGCALADLIYDKVSFESPEFKKYQTKQLGDGGLSPGKLVFTEELELFSDEKYTAILPSIVGNRSYDVLNVGGPSLVSMVLASQLLDRDHFDVRFYGIAGNDAYAEAIFKMVNQTPLDISQYITSKYKATPTTDVFSDPQYDSGHGERTFVNNIGAAWEYQPDHISDDFFDAHITCFGGTALVPVIHDQLTTLLLRARKQKCITVVNTVYDFRNQKKNPDMPWPLVDNFDDFDLIDVLIMDGEEAFKISGTHTIERAADFFATTAVGVFIITNGAQDIWAASNGRLFGKMAITQFPVSRWVGETLKTNHDLKGDTTGCGDNFAGGIIASLAMQLSANKRGTMSLSEAISWGVSSGGNCCFHVGGTFLETTTDEIKSKIQRIQLDYLQQIGKGV